jgi:hypothetical protein
LDPSLELADPLALPTRLAVHRVLKTLHELLKVSDALLEETEFDVWGRLR